MRVDEGGQAREEAIHHHHWPAPFIEHSFPSAAISRASLMGRQFLIMNLLMEGLVGLEELIGHSGRPARSGWQVAPATPMGPWGTLKAALGLLPSLSGGSSSIWAGGVWESIPVFRKKLTEENLFMEKMSVEGVIQSMPCAPCSLP